MSKIVEALRELLADHDDMARLMRGDLVEGDGVRFADLAQVYPEKWANARAALAEHDAQQAEPQRLNRLMALADAWANVCGGCDSEHLHHRKEREALRAAIVEALDMGEPVAWIDPSYFDGGVHYGYAVAPKKIVHDAVPLYAAKDKP